MSFLVIVAAIVVALLIFSGLRALMPIVGFIALIALAMFWLNSGSTPPASSPAIAGAATIASGPTTTPLQLSTAASLSAGYLEVRGKTNLPDGYMITIQASDTLGRNEWGGGATKVSGGAFEVRQLCMFQGHFSEAAAHNWSQPCDPSTYHFDLSGPAARVQPTDVQEIIGDRGQNFSGLHWRKMVFTRGGTGCYSDCVDHDLYYRWTSFVH